MCHLSGWLSRKENMSYMTLFVCDHKNLGIPMCLWSRLFSPLLSFLFINIMISQHHAEHPVLGTCFLHSILRRV